MRLDPILPISEEAVKSISFAKSVFFFEEGTEQGGVGEHFATLLYRSGWHGSFYLKGIPGFVKHAPMLKTLHRLGLDEHGMADFVGSECGKWQRKND